MDEDGMIRVGIFVFYDKWGHVSSYIKILLESILPLVHKLVIIVNGNITEESMNTLANYSKSIFVRENVGFDAGAYKEAFLRYLENENWEIWDEVLLFNDTFYGPIYSWDAVFEGMNKEKIDFWGLTKYEGGKLYGVGKDYPAHIQSYFLVCRKKMILSESFYRFWETLEMPLSRLAATENFEIRFTTYFKEEGFSYKVYTDICNSKLLFGNGSIPYLEKPYELLSELSFPVLKRKALQTTNFIKAKPALEYINNETNYDVELIHSHMKVLAKEDVELPFNLWKLEDFYVGHNRIFIYGCGKYGKITAAFFEYMKWKYEGFLVSAGEKDRDITLFVYEDMEFTSGDGIILALGKEAYNEVYPVVKKKLATNQLFLPNWK